jgi:pimeloyl-ACP methyl ester carboxylesterase
LLAEAVEMVAHTGVFLCYILPQAVWRAIALRFLVYGQSSLWNKSAWAVAHAWAACLPSSVDIHMPGLVIAKMHDLFTTPVLRTRAPHNSFSVELEGSNVSGHFPFLEDALRFNGQLETAA